MPEIEIRPAIEEDIPYLVALDHSYTSETVWQMEIQVREPLQVAVRFREARLPRSVRVEYPRSPRALQLDWQDRAAVLVALKEKQPVGYISLLTNVAPNTTWISDIVVLRSLRRQGIGSALLLAAQEWAIHHQTRSLVMEIQPKNSPAIRLAQKHGYEFCGYNERYFANLDIGLFFGKSSR
jgi:ribosomal protein S18 acetylase RimI-like enzyme